MNVKRRLGGLIAINLALLAILAIITWAPSSNAGSVTAPPSGDYIMVGGQVTGLTGNGVHVLDQRSGILLGMKYDLGSKKLKRMSIRNINNDAAKAGPGR